MLGIFLQRSIGVMPITFGQLSPADIAEGRMNVKAEELAYNPATGREISKLNWNASNAPVIKATLNWGIFQQYLLIIRFGNPCRPDCIYDAIMIGQQIKKAGPTNQYQPLQNLTMPMSLI